MSGVVQTEEIESAVHDIVSRYPAVGLAIGVVRNGSLEFFHGHGVADVGTRMPITEDTVLRIASITKTFTAISVMQLYEKGLIDLDEPVGGYLRAYRLVPASPGHRPVTIRHLLTHTAGMPEVAHPDGVFRPDFGESFPAGERLPSPAEFYGGAIRLRAEPGTRFVYNNHGPTTLGQIVEDVSGKTLADYFHDHIFQPLGMVDSCLKRSDAVETRLATGYEIHSGRLEEVDERDMVTAGAASIFSTPRDMSRYVAALLAGGEGEHGSILEPDTLEMMFDPHWQPDPRIPGMGLGFFRAERNGHVVVRHQGTHPGFHSEMALAPAAGIGVVAFTNGARQADFWLPAEVGAMLGRLLGSPVESMAPAAHHPERWTEMCGWYRLDAGLTDVRLRGMMGAGAEVFIRDGRLMFRFLTLIPALAGGFPLEPADPDDPDVYRIDLSDEGLDPIRIVFGRSDSGKVTRLLLDLMPLLLEKQPASTNPRKWMKGAVGALGLAAASTLSGKLRGRADRASR